MLSSMPIAMHCVMFSYLFRLLFLDGMKISNFCYCFVIVSWTNEPEKKSSAGATPNQLKFRFWWDAEEMKNFADFLEYKFPVKLNDCAIVNGRGAIWIASIWASRRFSGRASPRLCVENLKVNFFSSRHHSTKGENFPLCFMNEKQQNFSPAKWEKLFVRSTVIFISSPPKKKKSFPFKFLCRSEESFPFHIKVYAFLRLFLPETQKISMLFFSDVRRAERRSKETEKEKMLVQGQWSDKRNVYFLVILKEKTNGFIAFWRDS